MGVGVAGCDCDTFDDCFAFTAVCSCAGPACFAGCACFGCCGCAGCDSPCFDLPSSSACACCCCCCGFNCCGCNCCANNCLLWLLWLSLCSSFGFCPFGYSLSYSSPLRKMGPIIALMGSFAGS